MFEYLSISKLLSYSISIYKLYEVSSVLIDSYKAVKTLSNTFNYIYPVVTDPKNIKTVRSMTC